MKTLCNTKTRSLWIILLTVLWVPIAVEAHVTPIIKMWTLKETVQHLMPDSKLSVKEVELTGEQLDKLQSFGNWESDQTHYKFLVSHGDNNSLERAVVFIPEFTRHGTVVVAVSLNGRGKVIAAVITDIQTEILQWVQPLLQADYMNSFKGLDSGMNLTLDERWTANYNRMTQTYAVVIANGVKRSAQLFDQTFK